MNTTEHLDRIETWLIREALGEPDIARLFAGTCERMREAGIAIDRAMLSWSTLHPLIEAESVLWRTGEDARLNQYRHDDEDTEEWLQSPIKAMLDSRAKRLRRRLDAGNAPLEFPLLETLKADGFTDYLMLATAFELPTSTSETESTGMLVSWATRAPNGLTDETIAQIEYLQVRLALACRASIQAGIARTLAETYLGRWAGDQVLSGRIRHGDGEAIDAVIFFSDLRGSTALADRLDPADYITHLNAYFEATAGAVLAHGGEVLDFIGDAVLAVFPIGPAGLGPAAEEAYSAACAVADRLHDVAYRTPHKLECGVALSAGNVMFGNIGVADRLTFSVIGRTVNVAARIEAMTKRLSEPLLVTAEIVAALPAASFQSVGRFTLEGFDAPIELYAPNPAHRRETTTTSRSSG